MPGTTDVLGELLVLITGETAQYDKSIDASKKKTEKFEASMKKFGDTATRKVTLPLLAMGVAAIKFASDAEESRAKFNTAFAGIEKRAAQTAQQLSLQYGLARQSSEKLLGNTGDLLKGFGATADGALDFSLEIQKLAVDLASYNNVQGGAARVSNILTKSVLGNKDGLSELGVSLLDVDIKQELVRTGQDKLTGQAGKLAKAQATFNLILQQTEDAQGDYLRTSDSVANQTKLVQERTKDLAVEFGNILLPAVSSILKGANDLLGKFSSLDEGTKKLILGIGGIAAVAGPAVKGITAIRTAMTVLGATGGPIFLVATAIAAVIIALNKLEQIGLDQLSEDFADILENTNLTVKDIQQIQRDGAELRSNYGSIESAVAGIADKWGIAKSEVSKILIAGELLTIQDEDRLGTLISSFEQQEKIAAKTKEETDAAKKRADEARASAEARAERLKEEFNARTKLREQQNEAAQQIIDSAKAEIVLINEKIEEARKFTADDAKSKKLQEAAIKTLENQKVEIQNEATKERVGIERAYLDALKVLEDEEIAMAKDKRDKKIAFAEEVVSQSLGFANSLLSIAGNLATEELRILSSSLDSELEANETELADERRISQEKLNIKLEELAILSQAEQDFLDFKRELEEQKKQEDIAATEERILALLETGLIEDAEEARKLQRDLDNAATLSTLADEAKTAEELRIADIAKAKEDAAAAETAAEAKALGEQDQLQKEFAKKKYNIELAQFRASQALGIVEATISTAKGVAASIPNIPLMIAAGLAGAAQIGIIASQPTPARPQLNAGAVVAGTRRGVDVTVGENNQGEIIQGMGSKGSGLRKQLANETADVLMSRMGSGGGQTIINNFNGITKPSKRDLDQLAVWMRTPMVKANQRVGA